MLAWVLPVCVPATTAKRLRGVWAKDRFAAGAGSATRMPLPGFVRRGTANRRGAMQTHRSPKTATRRSGISRPSAYPAVAVPASRIATSLRAPEAVREIHEPLPVVGGEIVPAGANVIRHPPAHQRRIERGHLVGSDGGLAIQSVDRRRVRQRQVLPALVGPEIRIGAGDVRRPRGDERDELLLVDWQVVLAAVELLEVVAEPVGESAVDD